MTFSILPIIHFYLLKRMVFSSFCIINEEKKDDLWNAKIRPRVEIYF